MLTFNQLAVLACVLASLVAFLARRRHAMLWWASLGILVAGVGIVLYLPRSIASHSPPGWSPLSDGFAVDAEFQVLGDILEVAILGLTFTIILLVIEKMVEWRRAAGKEEMK